MSAAADDARSDEKKPAQPARKVTIFFKATGDAPQLKVNKVTVRCWRRDASTPLFSRLRSASAPSGSSSSSRSCARTWGATRWRVAARRSQHKRRNRSHVVRSTSPVPVPQVGVQPVARRRGGKPVRRVRRRRGQSARPRGSLCGDDGLGVTCLAAAQQRRDCLCVIAPDKWQGQVQSRNSPSYSSTRARLVCLPVLCCRQS